MEKDHLLQHFLNTLSPDNNLRSNSEKFLMNFINEKGILSKCLDISIDQDIPAHIRVVSVTFFKNKVRTSWYIDDNTSIESLRKFKIDDGEKNLIKTNLIESLVKSYSNQIIVNQLITSIEIILRFDPDWDQTLIQDSLNLLKSNSNQIEFIHTSLLLIYQVTKKYRFNIDANKRQLMNNIVIETFPIFEQILESFINKMSSNVQISQLIYLIFKIFKYVTLIEIPQYFTNDLNLFSKWCGYHFQIIDIEIDPQVLQEMDSPNEKSQYPLVKCKKWAFANLHRLKTKHAGVSTKDSQLKATIVEHFLPTILNHYLSTISKWTQSKETFYLSEACLYHLISFISECIQIEELSKIIIGQINPILKHVIFPLLSTTDELIEVFEDDQQEYFRRVYDLNPTSKTSDLAADDFIYTIIASYEEPNSLNSRSVSSINEIFQVINETFQNHSSNPNDKALTYQIEACLRVLKDIWSVLDKEGSPVKGQLNEIIKTFVVPSLMDFNHRWLQVRACENLSLLNHKYLENDLPLLELIFENLLKLFEKSNPISLRIESADSMAQLCLYYTTIEKRLSTNITIIMNELLELNNENEFDIINEIMDQFVSKFSKELEPFSYQLSVNLTQQFLRLAEETFNLENQNTNGTSSKKLQDEINDKEYQANGILNVLITMVISMNSQKEITVNLLKTFKELVSYILTNALSSYIDSTLELLDTINYTLKEIVPDMWDLLELVLESFDNYGYMYYDCYKPFLENVICYGFSNKNNIDTAKLQMLTMMLLKYLDEEFLEDEFEGITNTVVCLSSQLVLSIGNGDEKSGLYIKELSIKVMRIIEKVKGDFALIDVYNEMVKNYLKFFISLAYVNPGLLTQLSSELTNGEFVMKFMQDWFNNSNQMLITVFDVKLQILSLISLLRFNFSNPGNSQLNSLNTNLLIKLFELFEFLPQAIEKRLELMKKDVLSNSMAAREFEFEINEDDPELDELTKDTILDHVNVIDEFKRFFQAENEKIINELPIEKHKLLERLIN